MSGPGPTFKDTTPARRAPDGKPGSDTPNRGNTGSQRKGTPSRKELLAADYKTGAEMLAAPLATPSAAPRQSDGVHATHEYARGAASDLETLSKREWQPLKASTRDVIHGHAASAMLFHSEVYSFISSEGRHFISFLQKEAEGPGLGAQIFSALQTVGGTLLGADVPKAFAVVEALVKEVAAHAIGEGVGTNVHERTVKAFDILTGSIGGMSSPHVFSMAMMGSEGAHELGELAGSIDTLLEGEAGSLPQLNGRLTRGSTARFDSLREAGGDLDGDRLGDFAANANEMARDADLLATNVLDKIKAYKTRLAAFRAAAPRALAEARKMLGRIKDAYLSFVVGTRNNLLMAVVKLRVQEDHTQRFEFGAMDYSPLLSPGMAAWAEKSSIDELNARGFSVRVMVHYTSSRLAVTFRADGGLETMGRPSQLGSQASQLHRRTRGGGYQPVPGADVLLFDRVNGILRKTPLNKLGGQTIDAL